MADDKSQEALIADADVFFFYLRGGALEERASKIVSKAVSGELKLHASSEVYDDAITAIRSGGAPIGVAIKFVADLKAIPHITLPITAEVAEEAAKLYRLHAGRRRLHYFDAFHVACSKRYQITLVTSDSYVVEHAKDLGVSAIDLRRV